MAEPSHNASPARQRRVRHAGTGATLGLVEGTLRPRSDLLRSTALQAVFLAVLALPATRAAAQPAPAATALPTGGQVIAGQARITTATGAGTAAMTVKQATPYGAYDWKSFDIGKSASVTYQVPTSQAVSVNRGISPTPAAYTLLDLARSSPASSPPTAWWWCRTSRASCSPRVRRSTSTR